MSKCVVKIRFFSQKHKLQLETSMENSSLAGTTLEILQWLIGSNAGAPASGGMTVSKAIRHSLRELHTEEKVVETTDLLMVS